MADIQSATAEIRRGIKKKKKKKKKKNKLQDKNITRASATQGGHNESHSVLLTVVIIGTAGTTSCQSG